MAVWRVQAVAGVFVGGSKRLSFGDTLIRRGVLRRSTFEPEQRRAQGSSSHEGAGEASRRGCTSRVRGKACDQRRVVLKWDDQNSTPVCWEYLSLAGPESRRRAMHEASAGTAEACSRAQEAPLAMAFGVVSGSVHDGRGGTQPICLAFEAPGVR